MSDSKGLWHSLLRRLQAGAMRLHPRTEGCGPCPERIAFLHERSVHAVSSAAIPSADFPVDAVYTWVDGADPAHAAKRALYAPRQSDIHANGLEQARFRDNGELRYSLRSLERFAPWLRSIILLTDRQCPVWLKREHPKIRLVDHRECIPSRCLPTFNSHVIEAYLHRLPGLAEHYIYLNDDVFLARPCAKTEFFTPNGLPLAFTDWRLRRRDGYREGKSPHAHSYHNTLRFLAERHILTEADFIPAHGPYPQTRSNAEAAFAFFKEAIEGFDEDRFRTNAEIALYCHAIPLLLFAKKRLVPCDERYFYIMTRRRDRLAYYGALLRSQRDNAAPLFFCINDVDAKGARADWKEDLRRFLAAYFPQPSSFEVSSHE